MNKTVKTILLILVSVVLIAALVVSIWIGFLGLMAGEWGFQKKQNAKAMVAEYGLSQSEFLQHQEDFETVVTMLYSHFKDNPPENEHQSEWLHFEQNQTTGQMELMYSREHPETYGQVHIVVPYTKDQAESLNRVAKLVIWKEHYRADYVYYSPWEIEFFWNEQGEYLLVYRPDDEKPKSRNHATADWYAFDITDHWYHYKREHLR